MNLRGQKRKRSSNRKVNSPAAKKFANDNDMTDAHSEETIEDPALSETSSSDDSMQDDNPAVRYFIIYILREFCFINFILSSINNHFHR